MKSRDVIVERCGAADDFAEAVLSYMRREPPLDKADFQLRMANAAETKILVLGKEPNYRYNPMQITINRNTAKVLAKINDDLTWRT